ncbi:MAG: response regulator [Clostridia bacterium]|nr:response regulator [Clostridia bacterium]
MRNVNLIVADGDPIALRRNSEALRGMKDIDVVYETTDGADVISKVGKMNVDVVLTGLMLKRIDGLGVLEAIGNMRGKRPKALVLSKVTSDHMADIALSLGACYYMLKPVSEELLYQRICQFGRDGFSDQDFAEPSDFSAKRVQRELREMGITPQLKGYGYLKDAAVLYSKEEFLRKHITTELYPRIAQMHSASVSGVERAIRTAVQAAWKSGGFEQFYASGAGMAYDGKKPSSGKVIEYLAGKASNAGCKAN